MHKNDNKNAPWLPVSSCEVTHLRLAERRKVEYNPERSETKERDMDREELLNRITLDPGVLVGKPTIRGMRISVEILDALAAGVPEQELLEDYPALESDDIRAIRAISTGALSIVK
jgi:uncharacterized protein (DUF433 family)